MHNNESLVITIIGAGFSGTMVAVNLLKRATRPLVIKIIEPKKHVGLGVAYSTGKICHLLNVPAGKMSAFANDSEHFLRWLHNQGFSEVDATTFVPRLVFGQYIRATLDEALLNAPVKVKLERFETEAVSLNTGNKVTVSTKNGEIIQSDRVVLALGNFPSANPRIDDSTFYESKRYINWAWSKNWLDKLSIDEPVLLIGSGLTALDMVLSLHQQGHKGKIYIVSRRGLQPQVHQSASNYNYFLSEPPKTIRALVRAVRQEIKSAFLQGHDWRPVIDSLRPHTQAIWKNLSITEKRRFLRHARIYWDVHRHRVAPEVAQIFTQLSDSGQIIASSGRIQAYFEEDKSVKVVIRKRCSNVETIQVGFVINCTSPQSDYRRIQHPLIQQLLTEGLIRPHPLNLGLDVASNGALINAAGESKQLYTLGSPQIGYLWETIAVPEVRVQAEALAIELLK
jgi:uncharacterized NAD(P)/FAD-binding protein YdhS